MAGTYSRVKTFASGETLTASDLNAEFDNILNNSDPDGIDDASTNATAMQATADPYPGSSASLATDLRGEIQRLRYVIKQITGEAQWYIDPDSSLATLVSRNAYGIIPIPAGYMIPKSTAGAEYGIKEYATNDVMKEYYAFSGASTEHVTADIIMPEDWNLGTVKVKFIWSPGAGCTAADGVSWAVRASAVSNDDAIDASYGTGVIVADAVTAGVEGDILITSATAAVTIAGTPALGDTIQFDFYRKHDDASDDMTEDAYLFHAVVQYGRTNAAVSAW